MMQDETIIIRSLVLFELNNGLSPKVSHISLNYLLFNNGLGPWPKVNHIRVRVRV
jgi:hypothetical protein